MKCPNCYNENEAGRTTCKYCGSQLPYSEPEEVVVQEIVTTQETTSNSNEMSQSQENTTQSEVQRYQEEMFKEDIKQSTTGKKEKKSNKKVKKVLIILFILIILIGGIAGGIYYYTTITTPEKIYNKAITTFMEQTLQNEYFDASSSELQAKLSFTVPEDNILSVVNNFNFDTTIGLDLTNESGIFKLKVDKDGEVYIDGTVSGDLDHRLVYVGEPNIYEKYVRFDIPDDFVDQLEDEIDFNALATRNTSTERSIIKNTLETEIDKYIYKGTFERVKTSIQYNGKNKSITDDVYTLTEGQYKEVLNGLLSDLKANKEFLKSFGDNSEFVEETIEDILEEVKYLKEDDDVEVPNYFKVHLYSAGLKYDYMGIKVEYVSEQNRQNIYFTIIKTGDSSYFVDYSNISGMNEEKMQSNIDVEVPEKTKEEVVENDTTKIHSVTKYNEQEYVVDLEYKLTVNEGFTNIDLSNVKKSDDLVEEDFELMSENFSNLPIFDFAMGVVEYIQENGLNFELDSGINSETQLPNNIQLEENQSYLITNNAKVLVFEVPVAFENNYYGNMYKSYRKNNRIGNRAEIYLNLIQGNDVEKILEEYKSSYDFLFEKEYKTEVDKDGKEYQVEVESKYKDIKVGEIKEETKNDIKYYSLEVSYTSETKNKIKYYVTEFNDSYCYVVRVEDANDIVTQSEIDKLLNITKYID